MATVTGLTAERMLEIEANSVIGGSVDYRGRLVLITKGNKEVDAGIVTGSPGVGISRTDIEYSISESANVAPIDNWSNNLSEVPPGYFLWTKTTIRYTDNTTSVSYSIGRTGKDGDEGVPGPPGTNGKPSYLHIAYANSEDGREDFSTTLATGKTFLGTYTDFILDDSENPNDYNWVLIKGLDGATGPQGVEGPKGADGKSTYTWIKYADSPTSGMSEIPTGKTYMGIAYNKESSTESSDYSDYKWSLIQGQGVPGPPGEDGKPTYTWIRYANTELGSGMSDNPAGKAYIGLAYNKSTPTESSIASDYKWALIKGPDGNGIISSTITYQVSTSGTVAPTGTWTSEIPLIATGQFLWTRTVIVFADGAMTTSYSIGRNGDNGATGATGPSGVGVESMTTYYRVVTKGVTPPAKPTTASPPQGWTTIEPLYQEGTELYSTIRIVYTSNTFTYSDVSKVSSYTAAAEAVALAMNAKTTADGKNTIYKGPVRPNEMDPPAVVKVSDLWYKTSAENNDVIAIAVWNGVSWSPLRLTADSLIIPGSVGTISLEDGAISATKISAEAFNGKSITGAEIRGTYISGSEYHLNSFSGESNVYYNTFASTSGWTAGPNTTISVDNTLSHDASGSLRCVATTGNTPSVSFVPPQYSEIGSTEFSFWVFVGAATKLNINNSGKALKLNVPIPANTWTKVIWNDWDNNYQGTPAYRATISVTSGTTMRIDEVKIVSRAAATREIRLMRDETGTPILETTNESGGVTGRISAQTNAASFQAGYNEMHSLVGFRSGFGSAGSIRHYATFNAVGILHDTGAGNEDFVMENLYSGVAGFTIVDRRTGFQSSSNPRGIKLQSTAGPIKLFAGSGQAVDYNFGYLDGRTSMQRFGTTNERLAEAPFKERTRWVDTNTEFEWEYRNNKWYLVSGQVIANMLGPTSNTEGNQATVGSIIETWVLPVGQRLKLFASFSQYSTVAGGVSLVRVAFSSGNSTVGPTVYSASQVSRVESSVANRIIAGRGAALIRTMTVETSFSAGIFIVGDTTGVYGADQTHLWVESA